MEGGRRSQAAQGKGSIESTAVHLVPSARVL